MMLINSLSINIASKSSFTLENWLKSKSQVIYSKTIISVVTKSGLRFTLLASSFVNKVKDAIISTCIIVVAISTPFVTDSTLKGSKAGGIIAHTKLGIKITAKRMIAGISKLNLYFLSIILRSQITIIFNYLLINTSIESSIPAISEINHKDWHHT